MQKSSIIVKKNAVAKGTTMEETTMEETTMERILEKLEHISKNIDKVHTAIFEPNDGLFAKVTAINHWKNTKDKENDESIKRINEAEQQIELIDKRSIENERAINIVKWFAIALAGGVITIFTSIIQSKFSHLSKIPSISYIDVSF